MLNITRSSWRRLRPNTCWAVFSLPISQPHLPERKKDYHATARREILPLVAGTVLIGGIYYSYRALNRMDAEYEDYQVLLQSYEEKILKSEDPNKPQTIGIDLGTLFVKLGTTVPTVETVISREGERSVLRGTVQDYHGKLALEKYYAGNPAYDATPSLELVQDVVDRYSGNDTRRVVTVPQITDAQEYQNLAEASAWLPESVAAVLGAKFRGLLSDRDQTVLVIDVGAQETRLSVVTDTIVTADTTIDFGGESLVATLMKVLQDEAAPEPLTDARSLALLDSHAREAVAELASNTRVDIHVPYVFADPNNRHLTTSVARSVLDNALESYVGEKVLPNLDETSIEASMRPNNLQSLWVSVVTKLLEQAATYPPQLDRVLVVGGGSRSVYVRSTIQTAIERLMGDSDKLCLPDSTLAAELTVIGATTLLPSKRYDPVDGILSG